MVMCRADVETMLLAGGTLELSGQDLRGANLSELDLTGANLAYAQLDDASFRHCVMVSAILWAASATSADFTAADLTNANLGTADLTSASLDDAVVVGASLLGTVLTSTSRVGADFTGSDLAGATEEEQVTVDAIELTDADNGRTVAAAVGREVSVRLPENASTAYRWEVPEGLSITHDGYLRSDGEGVGGSGERQFTFTVPDQPIELTFALQRPWGEEPPAQTFTVRFTLGV